MVDSGDRIPTKSTGSRDHRQKTRHLAHPLRDPLQQLVYVAVALGSPEMSLLFPRVSILDHQGIYVEAIASVGRNATGRGVRVGKEALGLQRGQLRPNCRAARSYHFGSRVTAHRIARGDVQLQGLGKYL